jgi:hypothetical protein
MPLCRYRRELAERVKAGAQIGDWGPPANILANMALILMNTKKMTEQQSIDEIHRRWTNADIGPLGALYLMLLV